MGALAEMINTLNYRGVAFYLSSISSGSRVYKSKDGKTIKTALADYDGALIGAVDESLREDEDDDLIRYFDSETGEEE